MCSAQRDERGFSLVELMVVVLVMAVVVAIAMPAFFGARGRAADRAAQQSAVVGHTVAQILSSDGDLATLGGRGYLDEVQIVAMFAAEAPDMDWVDLRTQSTGPSVVSVHSASLGSIATWPGAIRHRFAVLSSSATCFFLAEYLDGEIEYRAMSQGVGASCKAENFWLGTIQPDGW